MQSGGGGGSGTGSSSLSFLDLVLPPSDRMAQPAQEAEDGGGEGKGVLKTGMAPAPPCAPRKLERTDDRTPFKLVPQRKASPETRREGDNPPSLGYLRMGPGWVGDGGADRTARLSPSFEPPMHPSEEGPSFPECCEHCPSFPPVPGRAVTSHRRAPRLLRIRRGRGSWGRGRAAREGCAGVGRGRAPQRARAGELSKCVTSSRAQ